MKTKSILLALAATMLVAACSTKTKQTTILGAFETEAPDSVQITTKAIAFDTIIPVQDKVFKVEIPVCDTALTVLSYKGGSNTIVSDGSKITLRFKMDHSLKASSEPANSVYIQYKALKDTLRAIEKAATVEIQNAGEDMTKIEEIANRYTEQMTNVNMKALDENKDNIISVLALSNLNYDLTTEEMDSILNTLGSNISKNANIKAMAKMVEGLKATAEGKMFTDFDVNGVKLSDFVGKGKYMLVDFWASWCGPCKREIPTIKAVYEKYAGADFDVLSVAVWDEEPNTIAAAKELGIVWNQIKGDKLKEPTDLYGIQGIPHIILFGPDGTILKRDLRGEQIEAEVVKYVQPKK